MPHRCHQTLRHRERIGRPELQRLVSRVEPHEVQQVVDELEQPETVLHRHRQQFARLAVGRTPEALRQAVRGTDDDRERRPQFVADVREEARLGLVELAQLAVPRFQQRPRVLQLPAQRELAETEAFVVVAARHHEDPGDEEKEDVRRQHLVAGTSGNHPHACEIGEKTERHHPGGVAERPAEQQGKADHHQVQPGIVGGTPAAAHRDHRADPRRGHQRDGPGDAVAGRLAPQSAERHVDSGKQHGAQGADAEERRRLPGINDPVHRRAAEHEQGRQQRGTPRVRHRHDMLVALEVAPQGLIGRSPRHPLPSFPP